MTSLPGVDARRRALAVLAATAVGLAGLAATGGSTWGATGPAARPAGLDPGLPVLGDALQEVVVTGAAAAQAVRRVGGAVGARLDLVGGVEAHVPAGRLVRLAGLPGVTAVTADREGVLGTLSYDETTTASSFARTTGATAGWAQGALGKGVGVAVIDSGVSPVQDLEGRLVKGPDLSGEGRHVDTYGHGTVMAGAIAGSGADSAGGPGGAYTGVAPQAHVVSVKVAGRNGAVDVSTVLQAMHWVSAYREQYGIRVLNLSWGVASTQDPGVDPLSYAVQRLWQQGIVVVVAAGNSGPKAGTVTKPADDPVVLTVGAYNDHATTDPSDDAVTAWSSRGPTAQGVVKPDVVAPGRTIVSTRSWGSAVEAEHPKALVGASYIKGSGTSQAAAVASGLAAVLLSARPELTPDQVKRLLTSTASPIAGVGGSTQGAGRVQLQHALTADPGPAVWQTTPATGLGSLEASRGGRNVSTVCPGATETVVIRGELTAQCEPWNGSTWTGSTWTGSTWTGSTWTGSTWTGSTWTDAAWSGSTWTGSTWTGSTWTGSTWTGNDFTTAEHGDTDFLLAFAGDRPRWWQRVAGEQSEPRPPMFEPGCRGAHRTC